MMCNFNLDSMAFYISRLTYLNLLVVETYLGRIAQSVANNAKVTGSIHVPAICNFRAAVV